MFRVASVAASATAIANGGWLPAVGDDLVGEAIGRLFREPFDLLLGRRTYDIFAAFWPYAKGHGKRLFGEGTPPGTLKMTGHMVSSAGNIVATYEPAGEVRLGSYATEQPSEREQ